MDKRRRVMERSMRLGHCICNPKTSCPCDVFREQGVCPCAGERAVAASGPVRLTQLVERPGCASKIDQAALKAVLAGLPNPADPRVLVGTAAGDDAGVFALGDGRPALVQTVDVFSPSVDDPYTFGQIAAANSVSDIYAMGGRPLTALSVVGFPIRELPDGVLREILRGGIDKMAEAGVSVIGGHSIQDREIKAGFAVTGLVDPKRIVTNAGARAGDALVLTKPLGTGIIAFAAQIGRAPAGAVEAAARSMAALNRAAADRMLALDAHACTDVTGFGLMGHLGEMAAASGVDVEIVCDDLPLLPGVFDCARDGIVPGAVERNRESSGDRVVAEADVPPAMLDICFDAQTSGGLLIAVAADRAGALVDALAGDGIAGASVIGRVVAAGEGRVRVRSRSGASRVVAAGPAAARARVAAGEPAAHQAEEPVMEPATGHLGCCGDAAGGIGAGSPGASGVPDVQRSFQEFLKKANAPGALDAHTKQAIAIALSVLAKCAPCVEIHIRKAREMGFSQEEIDEAAWMAISFGGSPLMIFYNGVRKG